MAGLLDSLFSAQGNVYPEQLPMGQDYLAGLDKLRRVPMLADLTAGQTPGVSFLNGGTDAVGQRQQASMDAIRTRPAAYPDPTAGGQPSAISQPAQVDIGAKLKEAESIRAKYPDLFPEPDFGDRATAFMANFQPNKTGLISAIGGGLQAARNPAMSSQARNLTVQALIKKGVEPEMAMLAATNPTLMQQLVTQMFSPKNQFEKLGPGEVGIDPRTGKEIARNENRAPKWSLSPEGYLVNESTGETRQIAVGGKPTDDIREFEYDMRQRNASGQQRIPFSQWMADKKTGNRASADALKSANFASLMAESEKRLANIIPDGENPLGFFGALRENLVPGEDIRNQIRSEDYQQYRQAAREWIRAKLRKESGAAIGKDEEEQEFRTYFPQYGDGPNVIRQKRQAREEALRGLVTESAGEFDKLQKNMAGLGHSIGGAKAPPAEAVEYLKQNPSLAGKFDEVYGVGASRQWLEQPQAQPVAIPAAQAPSATAPRAAPAQAKKPSVSDEMRRDLVVVSQNPTQENIAAIADKYSVDEKIIREILSQDPQIRRGTPLSSIIKQGPLYRGIVEGKGPMAEWVQRNKDYIP